MIPKVRGSWAGPRDAGVRRIWPFMAVDGA